jgi:ribonuclease HI
MRLKVFCDGLYEPRFSATGWSCWAWLAKDGDTAIASDGGCVGRGRDKFSNNVAEYHAVGRALRWMRDNGHEGEVFTDSALVVNQVSGRWDCNAEHLLPLRDRIRELMREMTNVQIQWVPRERNVEADALVNEIYRAERTKAA